jgi:hypothetical protein
VQQFSLPKMHKPIAGAEDTVAELGKGSPESDLQAMVVHPDHQVGVAKALTAPGLVAAGIQPDAYPGAGDGDGCSNAEANLIDSCPQPVATLNTIIAVAHAGTRTRKGE